LSPNDLPQQLSADHIVALSEESLAEQKLTDGKGADLVLDRIGGVVTGAHMCAS
jgi:NADPH:quinone reductase-like Zn-dependent oxidoreductase